jgi:uncharacterized protein (DUF302 family)
MDLGRGFRLDRHAAASHRMIDTKWPPLSKGGPCITAFTSGAANRSRLTMKKVLLSLLVVLLPLTFLPAQARAEGMTIADTVLKMPLAEDVSMDDAVESMMLRANNLNFKMVAHLPLYKELESMGVETKRIEIFQFCDARIANQMIMENIDFSAYLPCRITLIEDQEGQAWLTTLDLNKVIEMADLPPNLMEHAVKVRDTIQEIMTAGATGDL